MKQLAVVMDPISSINPQTDSTLLVLLEAQERGYMLWHITAQNLFIQNGASFALAQKIRVFDHDTRWFEILEEKRIKLSAMQLILMRVDPPVTMEYMYITYALELAEKSGAHVVNCPQGIRDANEKAIVHYFPELIPPQLITKNRSLIKNFLEEHHKVVLKPLDNGKGEGVLFAEKDHLNTDVLIDSITQKGEKTIVVQRYLPEIHTDGDLRIFMIDGQALPYGLLRKPRPYQLRANTAAGGLTELIRLSGKHYEIAQKIGDFLIQKGLSWVGIDVIGNYLTEINVTSPTGLRRVQKLSEINFAPLLLNAFEKGFDNEQ